MKKLYALTTEKRAIDLSLSENPLGCSPLVSSAFKKLRVDFNDYPLPNGRRLRNKLAQKFSLSEDNFLVANGSESIINNLPRILCNPGDQVLIPKLTFPLFTISAESAGARVVLVEMTGSLGIDLSKILKKISERTRLIFLCNPNNPTGSLLSKAAIINFVKKVPERVLVVVDEANIEFGGKSMINEVAKRCNLMVLRTFSKGFGLAALRVGFAVANKKIIQKLEKETPIFQISSISEHLAGVALKDDNFLQETRGVTNNQRRLLKSELEKLGFVIFPSQANNLFARLPSSLSAKQFAHKLKEKDVSVVTGSNFDGFDDSFFRVSIRDAQTNQMFIQKMKEIIRETM